MKMRKIKENVFWLAASANLAEIIAAKHQSF
jgi:hypothetical protein